MSTNKYLARIKNKRRYGDPWVSKNRVLNPNKSKRHCPIYRNPNFDNDETKLLIQLWGDPKVQRELITTHKKHLVIAQLSAKMEEYGYYRSAEEITTRIKNMKCFYNRLKKEMELNPNLDPSWRHYTDMDAIMTRPIFSVRPNEVPAPSLKYLMEQEEEKRKERKRKAEEEGIDISDSDDDISDVLAVPLTHSAERSEDECIIPDADIEFECDDITLAAIANGAAATDKCDKATSKDMENNIISADDELLIKMEVQSDEYEEANGSNKKQSQTKTCTKNKSDELELLTPKNEPIDVDDFTPNNNDKKTPEMPIVVSAPNLMGILSQPISSQAMVTSRALANFSMAPSTCYTNTSAASSGSPMIISSATPSKISVVSPTILMPQTNQIVSTDATHSSVPMRIGGNLQAFLTSAGAMPTAMTGPNGMKFILVNTGDQRRATATGAQTVTMATAAHTTTLGNLKTNQSLQMSPKVSNLTSTRTQRTLQNPSTKTSVSSSKKLPASSQSEKGETLRRKELAGIKSTLMRLLKAREDGNELQSQRLAIERERLQHERTVSEKYIAIFEQNQKFQQQLLQQQQQILQIQQQQQFMQPQQRPTTMQQLFATTANGTSTAIQNANGQLMMPPKLLITTMVPTSAANASGAINTNLSSKVLTTSNFKTLTKNLNASVSGDAGGGVGVVAADKPLLIPKEEPEN